MDLSRRQVLGGSLAALGSAFVATVRAEPRAQGAPGPGSAAEPFRYALNTSTIRGSNLGIVAEIDVMARAGYSGVEPWINEIDAYTRDGGTLGDLRRRFADAGLTVENAIGFNSALVADPAGRAEALERLKVDMDKVAQIGGTRIAMPPGRGQGGYSLDDAVGYYREALEAGRAIGVTPLLELWGNNATFGPLRNGIYVTTATGDPDASLLLDTFHLYRSGTPFAGLRQINGAALHVLHINDYPDVSDSSTLNDGNRVYPGDGAAPLGQIFRDLRDNGFRGALSLELFNREYWTMSAEDNATMGLDKMRAAVRSALA